MLLRRLVRPLFAAWFVAEGLDALRHPAPHVESARSGLSLVEGQGRARRVTDRLPDRLTSGRLTDTQLTVAVRAHGAAMVGAAALLALGRAPRTAALVLAGLTAPLVVANLPDRESRTTQETQARRDRLVRSLSFTAGAVLVALDREGRPGLRWRLDAAHDHRVATRTAEQG